MSVNPFFLTEYEFEQWAEEQDRKFNDIHKLLSHLKFIPSFWKCGNGTFIISKSAKRNNMLQLTRFDNNNIPVYDLCRELNDIKDIVTELIQSESTIQTINYIN
jgi:hypothetical protein